MLVVRQVYVQQTRFISRATRNVSLFVQWPTAKALRYDIKSFLSDVKIWVGILFLICLILAFCSNILYRINIQVITYLFSNHMTTMIIITRVISTPMTDPATAPVEEKLTHYLIIIWYILNLLIIYRWFRLAKTRKGH